LFIIGAHDTGKSETKQPNDEAARWSCVAVCWWWAAYLPSAASTFRSVL